MAKGTKRRSSSRYDVFEDGGPIPLPDYAMFNEACKEAAVELGIPAKDVMHIYKDFISVSLELLFPEQNPRALSDAELLFPRRIMNVPKIASLEVTEKSLWHWRKVQQAIDNARQKMNNNTKKTE